MSLLKPRISEADELNYGARHIAAGSPEVQLLKNSGIIKNIDGLEANTVDLMGQVGLGMSTVLTRIAMILESGETDSVKLAAAKLALSLHMHPAFVPKKTSEEKSNPAIIFNISTPAGAKTEVNMANVLVPGGQKLESW